MARFEFRDGRSSKFWEISLSGESFTTRWGKIGTAGQQTSKTFDDASAAQREHDKLVARKLKEGYQLAADAESVAVAAPTSTEGSPTATTVDVLNYECGDLDANDEYTLEVVRPAADGVRFTVKGSAMKPVSVHVTEAALEGGVGVLRLEQDVLFAGDTEVPDGFVSNEWTAPFLVPRRFIRELAQQETSTLKIYGEEAVFTRDDGQGAEEKKWSKRLGLPVLKAVNDQMTLIVSANPALPMLLSREAGEPMVVWAKGALSAWPRTASPASQARPPKKGRAGSEEALIEQLRGDPAESKRVLAAALTPAGARALLEASWVDARGSVQVAAQNARTRDSAALFSTAAVGLLEEILATEPLRAAWEKHMSDRPVHTAARTIRQNQIRTLTSLVTTEDLQGHPAVIEKLRTIACTFDDWEALDLRSLLTINAHDRVCIERSLTELHGSDDERGALGRDALYTLFWVDPAAASAAIAADLADERLQTDEGQNFAVRLVSGFAMPSQPAWAKACLQLWRFVPQTRVAVEDWVSSQVYPRFGASPNEALLAQVEPKSRDWQVLLASLAVRDSTLFERLGEAGVPDELLSGAILEAWVLADLLGVFRLDGAARLVAAFERVPEADALRMAERWATACVDQPGRCTLLWPYLAPRATLPFRGLMEVLLAALLPVDPEGPEVSELRAALAKL
jgi:predicted DNA-binding WGR domain protein